TGHTACTNTHDHGHRWSGPARPQRRHQTDGTEDHQQTGGEPALAGRVDGHRRRQRPYSDDREDHTPGGQRRPVSGMSFHRRTSTLPTFRLACSTSSPPGPSDPRSVTVCPDCPMPPQCSPNTSALPTLTCTSARTSTLDGRVTVRLPAPNVIWTS